MLLSPNLTCRLVTSQPGLRFQKPVTSICMTKCCYTYCMAAAKFSMPLILPHGLASHMHAQRYLLIQGDLEAPGESLKPFKWLTLQHPPVKACFAVVCIRLLVKPGGVELCPPGCCLCRQVALQREQWVYLRQHESLGIFRNEADVLAYAMLSQTICCICPLSCLGETTRKHYVIKQHR